ncbi:hypothetical protein B4U80_03193 [Leptotrombidium deliense]|uniref:Uncharacterized protein n=1 Tax=Leptotrombidium deliense TaxID=299467 RepID=A0A443SCZ1_9ACAR|nr:hypothetical protein B4U80_03193 [Leptotrombidium deliense]
MYLLIICLLPCFTLQSNLTDLTNDENGAEVNPSNYDILSSSIFGHPLRNMVLRSFEGYRKLLRDSNPIEDSLRENLRLSNLLRIRHLDPLSLPKPIIMEHRDPKTPILGKVKVTLEDVHVAGLSAFKVEQLNGFGRNLYFEHSIPQLDTIANYTVDYHLFDEIPLRISKGALKASAPNAHILGSFELFPDLLRAWFRIAQLNFTTSVDDFNLKVYPDYLISDRFVVERSTIHKLNSAIKSMLPNVTDYLKLTFSRAIDLRFQ